MSNLNDKTIQAGWEERLSHLVDQNLIRERQIVSPWHPGRVIVAGKVLWDFSSNDYHGLSRRREVQDAAVNRTLAWGVGARASHLISGWSPAHAELVEDLKRFESVEDVTLFPTGYAACQGAVSTVVEAEDVVFCDRDLHACLIDGIRLSGARLRVYRRNQLEKLERELTKSQSESGRLWIVTESVFGMDGEFAPLVELVKLAKKYDAYLICDEAHATGAVGKTGAGLITDLIDRGKLTTEEVASRIPVRIGTLSKGLGSQGGFVGGSETLAKLLWNCSRTQMFTTGLAIPACAAASAAIRLFQAEPERIAWLQTSSQKFREQLMSSGFELAGETTSAIVPVILNSPQRTLYWKEQLLEAGFLVGAIRPPTVAEGQSRIRISISSVFTDETLQALLSTLESLKNNEGNV